MNEQLVNESIVFNTPFEVGLRTLVILDNSSSSLDLQRIIYYDYLILHSNDTGLINAPMSLHPNIPNRFGGLVIRRKAMQLGLDLMYSKSLIDIVFNEKGITYASNLLTAPFLELLNSTYSNKLRSNTKWVMEHFSHLGDEELKKYFETNYNKWGEEFMNTELWLGDIE